MNDVDILKHVKSVRAAAAVYLVTAMVGCKAKQSIVMLPVILYNVGNQRKDVVAHSQISKCHRAFRAVFMHPEVIVAIEKHDKIMLIAQNNLDRLCVYLRPFQNCNNPYPAQEKFFPDCSFCKKR